MSRIPPLNRRPFTSPNAGNAEGAAPYCHPRRGSRILARIGSSTAKRGRGTMRSMVEGASASTNFDVKARSRIA